MIGGRPGTVGGSTIATLSWLSSAAKTRWSVSIISLFSAQNGKREAGSGSGWTAQRLQAGVGAMDVERATISRVETLHEASRDQAPSVHQDKERQFERERNDTGRQHHHAHAHQHTRHHHIDDQEWQEQHEAHFESP